MKTHYLGITLAGLLLAGCGGGSDNAVRTDVAPTVSGLTDVNIAANQESQPISFTVSDEQVGRVSLVANSDNQAVLPDDGLRIAGSGSNRTLTITPSIDALGDAFVTVTATDQGGLSSNSSFLVILDPEQKSIQQFTRTEFPSEANAAPELINAVEFIQDADQDDFGDLFSQ